MSRRDDDTPIPGPDAPVADGEQARAEEFAGLLDGMLDGAPPPPAMDSDSRALLEVANMVVASTHSLELDGAQNIIDSALEAAITGRKPKLVEADSGAAVASLDERRSRIGRVLPWAVAVAAAAAAIFLFVSRPDQRASAPTPTVAVAPDLGITEINRSRPADPLIGQIARESADRASTRLDTIYSDRMAGYRDLRFRTQLGGTP
jgi:hypothetical protein